MIESITAAIVRVAVVVVLFAPKIPARAEVQNKGRAEQPIPRFEEYAVNDAFRGSPAALRFSRFAADNIRSKLRDHMSGQPNLAGHYEFVTWGCGTNCTAGAIVDLKTGIVYSPPLTERTEWLPEWRGWGICAQSWEGPWEVRIESRLIIIRTID